MYLLRAAESGPG